MTEVLRKVGDPQLQGARLPDEQLVEKARTLVADKHLLLLAGNVQEFSQLSLIAELDHPFAIMSTSRDAFASSGFADFPVGEMTPEDADALVLRLSNYADIEVRRDVAARCRLNGLRS